MYVVYHVDSTMEESRHKHLGHAQNKADRLSIERQRHYAATTVEDYNTNVVKMVTRRNLLSGKEYQEPSNTPNYMSPSSETYWSM